MQECIDESEMYNYQGIQPSNNKFINEILGVHFTWLECNSHFTPCFVAHNKEPQLFPIFNRSMSSSEAKTLRVCANSFLDHLSLVVETIEAFGPPLEES